MAMNVGRVLSDPCGAGPRPISARPLSPARRYRTDLGVVADEADWGHEEPPDAPRRLLADERAHIRADPGFGCAAGALVGDVVARDARSRSDPCGCGRDLGRIWVACFDNP